MTDTVRFVALRSHMKAFELAHPVALTDAEIMFPSRVLRSPDGTHYIDMTDSDYDNAVSAMQQAGSRAQRYGGC